MATTHRRAANVHVENNNMHPENPSFHAHHSPMGALASFTCGAQGASGGMGLELPGPFPGEITFGFLDSSNTLHAMPLFEGGTSSEAERYVEGKEGTVGRLATMAVDRDYRWATDSFRARSGDVDVQVDILSPFFSIPDPATASPRELAFACCPAVHLRMRFKNESSAAVRGLFALGIDHRWASLGQRSGGALVGATSRDTIGFASQTPGARCFIDFDCISAMNRKHTTPEFLLGPTAGLEIQVPAGGEIELDVVLGFYRQGKATYNREMVYFYTRHFSSLDQVLAFALDQRAEYLQQAAERDRELASAPLNDEQKFLIAHATRGYYASTQWLWDGGQSVWVVNEGEYLMMNTFDLTVDMLFFEMRFNPWTVRNVLGQFVSDYAFHDQVFAPEDPHTLYPGGLSFTHDMGVMNHWSPRGRSSYEVAGLDRACFSHMTSEQLTNWVLCTGVYLAQTGDDEFLNRHLGTLEACLRSLQNRDHPDPTKRNGIMGFDSDRTLGTGDDGQLRMGGEITTYDSLDHSLGQARNNIYLGGKMWASCLLLAQLFERSGKPALAAEAERGAKLAAATLTAGYNPELGYIPAVLEGDNTSAIIPAIEALVYPWLTGLRESVTEDGAYGDYIRVLKQHLTHVLKPGICLYPDGAWKLSSSADNSWMSKIGLCQFVATTILGFDFGTDQARADQAHARWQREGATLSACSDQFRSGVAHGSLYYPRIVTNILWLQNA